MDEMLRPPINRAMRTLDRSFFRKQIGLSAVSVGSLKHISRIRAELLKNRDALVLERMQNVWPDPSDTSRKCILLRPGIRHDDVVTWPQSVRQTIDTEESIKIIPYNLEIDYTYWTYQDIMTSILPEDYLQGEDVPTRFTIVGHVAHLNLREHALPYKHLIAQVLLDKNPTVRTVINKTQNVGEEDVYRTFAYEVLAGPDDMDVTLSEGDCTFRFDYSKVYWNTRLQAEHLRMNNMFKPGEAVCDIMAGVGPFALPAGKRGVLVWANDLNPESFKYLERGIKQNKVDQLVRPFNRDGAKFIKEATANLYREYPREITLTDNSKRSRKQSPNRKTRSAPTTRTIQQPQFFTHFVMNLPASAITFLPNFAGLYTQLSPDGKREAWPLPVAHVYTFALKPEKGGTNRAEIERVVEDVSRLLGYPFRAGEEIAEGEQVRAWEEGVVRVFDVRDVAPKKRMFCVSFLLPAEVAWAAVLPTAVGGEVDGNREKGRGGGAEG